MSKLGKFLGLGRLKYKVTHSAWLTDRRNLKAIKNFSGTFEVVEFKFIDVADPYDLKWKEWSRVYEYELMLSKLRELNANKESRVHNTCWGFHGVHVEFKNQLESLYVNTVNSDVRPSDIAHTDIFDVTQPVPPIWDAAFDFVLNVSTVEEIDYPHILVIENLLSMVKPGGYLVVSFDYPGMQLHMVEKLFGRKVTYPANPLRGGNSPAPNPGFDFLKAGYFVLKRTS